MPASASEQRPTILMTTPAPQCGTLWVAAQKLCSVGSPSRVKRTGRRGQGGVLMPRTSQFTKHPSNVSSNPYKTLQG